MKISAHLAIVGFILLSTLEIRANDRDFDRVLAPILIDRCIDCHQGPKPKGGLDLTRKDSTLQALVPGKPEESLIWQRIAADEMPPKKPLSAADQLVIQRWIQSGAPWGTNPIEPFRITTARRAGFDWWSLQPPKPVPIPAISRRQAISRNPIDAFVQARLDKVGLQLSPEANRRTLIRRLMVDLLGLLPSPQEVDAFVSDPRPDAYERLVDRLLAHPAHGERWARHWLDVVHFGESDGFERNMPRRNAWPYRNWVIQAFNQDLPYDQFCRLQVAGDVLAPGQRQSIEALGFLVTGVHNTVLGSNAEARETARQDELEDLVGVVGQTFLGLTVNCARCHDHKFDPISQRDYYSLIACLRGVQHGERGLPTPEIDSALIRVREQEQRFQQRLRGIEEPARQKALAARGQQVKLPAPPRPLAAWDFSQGYRDLLGKLDGQAVGAVQQTQAGIVLTGNNAFVRTLPLTKEIREKTLEVWVKLDNIQQQGGGVISVQTVDGNVFDAIVFGEQQRGRWMAGSDLFRRTRSLEGPEETEAHRQIVHVALTYSADGTIAAYRNGKPYGKPYRTDGIVSFPAGKTVVAFGIRHEPAGGNRMLTGTILRAHLYDQTLSASDVQHSFQSQGGFVSESDLLRHLDPETRRQREQLLQQLQRVAADIAELNRQKEQKIYAPSFEQPPISHVLNRGQVNSVGPLVSPGGVASLGVSLPAALKPDAPENERRRWLAEWLTHPSNPLFARVMVNRVWHYHFGIGLVETPSDLGFNGSKPSHPELLDWLANDFRQNRYSLKRLHRLIVTSAAYRQRSTPYAQGMALDAESRLLWRRRPQRLDAEVLRDSMLAIAGLLNREQGGVGFSDYREEYLNGTTYFDPLDPVGSAFHRRSVYRFIPRGANQGLLDSFDCPDPAAAAPRRSATTTPLQALSLWNGAFALRMSQTLAERIVQEVPPSSTSANETQIQQAFLLVLQRSPRPDEMKAAASLIQRHGLPALCRVLFNSNEFLMLD